MNPLPNYPGSKGGSGVAKRIISMMPPHRIYIEAFLGGGAVMRLKRPAKINIGYDLSPAVVASWQTACSADLAKEDGTRAPLIVQVVDVVAKMINRPGSFARDALVYCDPPYLKSTRTRLFYECEMASPDEHKAFLAAARSLSCMVMISHYPCSLYDSMLAGWNCFRFKAMTRGGPRTECVWFNFPEPTTFHDPRFLGNGFRERERIKRKSRRWKQRFAKMGNAERQVVANAVG